MSLEDIKKDLSKKLYNSKHEMLERYGVTNPIEWDMISSIRSIPFVVTNYMKVAFPDDFDYQILMYSLHNYLILTGEGKILMLEESKNEIVKKTFFESVDKFWKETVEKKLKELRNKVIDMDSGIIPEDLDSDLKKLLKDKNVVYLFNKYREYLIVKLESYKREYKGWEPLFLFPEWWAAHKKGLESDYDKLSKSLPLFFNFACDNGLVVLHEGKFVFFDLWFGSVKLTKEQLESEESAITVFDTAEQLWDNLLKKDIDFDYEMDNLWE